MSAPTTVRSATRRLVGLTALRWLPVGLTTPITVLLAQARGLTLGEIGVLFTVHGVLVVSLELPTGGLADVFGRRPVVIVAGVLHLGSCLLFATASSFGGFLVAMVALGVGRVLDSGPVEAWYVDTVHRIDPHADVAPGLAAQAGADGASLAVGAVVGGFLPALFGGAGAAGLALPFLGAAALDVLFVVVVLRLLTEHRPARTAGVLAGLASGLRAVPASVGQSVRLVGTDTTMRRVLLLTAIGGAGLVVCELLGPVRFAELASGDQNGAAVYGVVLAVSFAAAAAGSLAAPVLRRTLRGSTRATCAALFVLGALALGVVALPGVLLAAAVGFALYYLAHGAGWPLLSAVLHGRADAAHRAGAVSAMSLALALGGIAGNLAVPPLAARTSTGAGFAVVGGLVLLGALACRPLPRVTRPAPAEVIAAA